MDLAGPGRDEDKGLDAGANRELVSPALSGGVVAKQRTQPLCYWAVGAALAGWLSLPALWTVYGAIILGLLGIALGSRAIPLTGRDRQDGRGWAVLGIFLGALGLLYGLLGALEMIPTMTEYLVDL